MSKKCTPGVHIVKSTVYGFTSVNSWGHITHNTIHVGDAISEAYQCRLYTSLYSFTILLYIQYSTLCSGRQHDMQCISLK